LLSFSISANQTSNFENSSPSRFTRAGDPGGPNPSQRKKPQPSFPWPPAPGRRRRQGGREHPDELTPREEGVTGLHRGEESAVVHGELDVWLGQERGGGLGGCGT
jgi:hypothetical protein